MKKTFALLAMLTLVFAFSVNVMALDSPEYNGTTEETTTSTETTSTEEYFGGTTAVTDDETVTSDDEYSNSKPTESETDQTSTTTSTTSSSPKTADMGTPTALVFVALSMAAFTIYAGKRARE